MRPSPSSSRGSLAALTWFLLLGSLVPLGCGGADISPFADDDCDGSTCSGDPLVDSGASTDSAPPPDASPEPTHDSGSTATTDSGVAPAVDSATTAVDVGIDSGPATPCNRDEECASALCNWKTRHCSSPGVDGDPCSRDEECASALCNWKTSRCSTPAADGSPCSRDEECAGALCNWKTSRCAPQGLSGAPCSRDEECFSTICQTAISQCF